MILPDVNVLVYAFRDDAKRHQDYRSWLISTINGREDLALTDAAIVGFIRVVTNHRIYERPATTAAATEFADALIGAPRARWIRPDQPTWNRFSQLAQIDRQIRGNLVPDAWLAALAISHGCRLATADRGFGRFDGLDWFDPAAD